RSARNLAINNRDAQDFGNASKYFVVALQLYQGLRQYAWVVRTRWSIARLTLVAGSFQHAEGRLRAAVQSLESKGLLSDASDARLDLAEALLMLGRLDEVETLC